MIIKSSEIAILIKNLESQVQMSKLQSKNYQFSLVYGGQGRTQNIFSGGGAKPVLKNFLRISSIGKHILFEFFGGQQPPCPQLCTAMMEANTYHLVSLLCICMNYFDLIPRQQNTKTFTVSVKNR